MKINISKLFSWVIILFLPLSLYEFIIPSVSIGDVLIMSSIVMGLIVAVKKKINNIFTLEIFIYILFIICNSMIQFIINNNEIDNGIFSLFRYLLFMTFVLIIPKHFLDREYTYKYYQLMGTVFAIYSILQFLCFYSFKIILPINILPFNTMSDFTRIQESSRYLDGIVLFRPYSVFIEPSYFAIYESYILYWLVNKKENKNKKDLVSIISITIAMCLSGTTGIVMVMLSFIRKISKICLRNFFKTTLYILILGICIYTFFNTNYGKIMFNRIFSEDGLGSSTEGRMGNLSALKEEISNEPKTFIIGNGVWAEYEYLPTIGRVILNFGITGVIVIILLLYFLYKKSNKDGKEFMFLFIISFIATNSLFNITSVLAFSLIIMNFRRKKNEKNRLSNMV